MRKTLTLDELKDIKTNSYRRIIIFSESDLDLFKEGSFNNYFSEEDIEYVIEKYLICVKNTEKNLQDFSSKNLPYLFIFNDVEVPKNKEFFESSNWIIIK